MNSAKLSVVIPVYNTEKYLEKCLDSILSQIYNNLQIIIVNDASKGNCDEIVKKYMKLDERIQYFVHEENKGLFRARVTGAEKATGDYITFVDSDDYLSNDFYFGMMKKAIEGDFDIVANDTVRENEAEFRNQFTMHKICFNEELYGDDVKNTFFDQAGACYAWHTIWNKIYKKSVWDKCMPEYKKIDQHLIMTEDIAFSSLLFFNAESFASVKSGAYYYCINENASTNSSNITFEKFKKNVTDIALVFNFVENYLKAHNPSERVMKGFNLYRIRYAAIWNNMKLREYSTPPYNRKAEELINSIAPVTEKQTRENSFFFERLNSKYNNGLQDIKCQIASVDIKVVSFDVFDTLIVRAVWEPEDVFRIMQKDFEAICPELAEANFISLRKSAEVISRNILPLAHCGYQDVTLTEIYEEFRKLTGISPKQADAIKKLEEETELSLVSERKTGKELLKFALACGKQVILTSDMYLERPVIEDMLKKCGYEDLTLYLSSEIRLVKFTGALFEHVVGMVNVASDEILHIGDNWNTDIVMSKGKGLRAAFLPKTKDIFCNSYSGNPTNGLSEIGNIVGNSLTTWKSTQTSLSYRCMLAIVANGLFDNPFISWNNETDFDANPHIMGYYALGMHVVSICAWLAKIAKEISTKNVCFLARDGYLPIKVFEKMKSYLGMDDAKLNYVPCSRKSLMPWIINDVNGLYSLPLSHLSHTPRSFVQAVECCTRPIDEEGFNELLKNTSFNAERRFVSDREYFEFITWYKENLFSEDILESNKKMVSEYYRSTIAKGALVFDMGYSGRIPSALSKCLGYPVTYAYIHKDLNSIGDYIRRDGLDIRTMYDFIPSNTDLIRELFFSEQNNQCKGFIRENGTIIPQFEIRDIDYTERFVFGKFIESALKFADDYLAELGKIVKPDDIDYIVASMPFEGLLSISRIADRQVLGAMVSDDTVYGNCDTINAAAFWSKLPYDSACIRKTDMATNNIASVAYQQDEYSVSVFGLSKFRKFIVYLYCDPARLKEKVKVKFAKNKFIYTVSKSCYHFLKKIRFVKER